ncbi:coiled-coil domain-containing protein 117 [Mixophyes fleayi]|uniref:coiled-coil domain-containing protein 117 n=1 Tax=Mixophyes fleayi TaxID=3061075 RepID=UPI003F4DEA76
MAAVCRAFSAVPLCGMEYRQTSNSFLLRPNPSGILESPCLGTSANDLNQINSISMGSGLNHNDSVFSNYSQYNPNVTGGNEALFQRPEGGHTLSPKTCSGPSGQRRKKHKHQYDDCDCPLKKRKLSSSPTTPALDGCHGVGIVTEESQQPSWNSSQPQVKQTTVLPDLRDQSFEMMHTVLAEDMEETSVESQSEATLRRIRDIESRLEEEDDEDDDDDDETRADNLPTLVLSDVLVEGLKKGLDESLTKKIVDSMNCPSMELVLWKPQPEFLIDKLQCIVNSYKDDPEIAKQAHSTPGTSFLQAVDSLCADKQCTSTLHCDDTLWNREEEEEEMEL